MRIWVKRGLLLCSLAALCAMLSLATLAVGYICLLYTSRCV